LNANVRLSQESDLPAASLPAASVRRVEPNTRDSAEAGLGPISGNAAKILDILLLSVSFAIALGALVYAEPPRFGQNVLDLQVSVKHLAIVFGGWLLWSICLWSTGIYHSVKGRTSKQLFRQICIGSTLCTLIAAVGLIPLYHGGGLIQPLLLFWVGSSALLLASRGARLWYLDQVKPRFRVTRQAIIVGSGPRAQQLAENLRSHDTYDYELLGFVDSDAQRLSDGSLIRVIGSLDDLETIVMKEQVDDVFIALPLRSRYQDIERALAVCEQAGVQSQYLSDLFTTTITKKKVVDGQDGERVILRMVHYDHRRHIKRTVDLLGSAIGLVLLAPLLLIVAILIRLTSPGPIFFSQKRYGLNKRLFNMYKFRSMVPDAEAQQAALEHQNESAGPVFKIKKDPRVTPIGRIMRSTSIDELPQLVNVLFGHMSLVGPRPLPMRDVSRFSEASLMRRFSVKPGMTGLWQVSGRSNTSFSGWIMLDLHYIDHWSLALDLRILFRTLSVVMRRTGAS
jgi:exopolysaccharide biosynthesis polyprenyl glycosylphosphotransferase